MRKFFAILLCFLFLAPAFAKKSPVVKPKMVETYSEWQESAKEIPLESRKYKRPEIEIKAKLNKIVDPVPYLVKYNSPIGGYEVDLREIRDAKTLASIGVSSPSFDKLAIVYYYYAPLYNQISSELFIVPLETSKSRIDRILDAKVIDTNKGFNLTSGTADFQQDLYSALSIVDWAPYGRAILLKEKIGTSNSGVFRTNLCAVLVGKHENTIKKFPQLQEIIMKYWRENSALVLNRYRWDINILGFSEQDPDKAIVLAYANEKGGKEVFLGIWSVNIYTDEVELVSLKNADVGISVNGVILKFRTQ